MLAVLLVAGMCAHAAGRRSVGRRDARLVGCTKYDQNANLQLLGPANDLVVMRRTCW